MNNFSLRADEQFGQVFEATTNLYDETLITFTGKIMMRSPLEKCGVTHYRNSVVTKIYRDDVLSNMKFYTVTN